MRNKRSACFTVCLLAGISLPLCCAASESEPDVTVILDMKGTWSPVALREMQREASQIIGPSGLRLDWRQREDIKEAVFHDLVVLTFRGACEFSPAPPLYDELGPLAFTRTSDGAIQPFGEVNCDHVVNSVRDAMLGSDYAKGEMLVGRALGRVVAHELVHMLTKSGIHAHDGVQRSALSGKQLISESLPLSLDDVNRMKAGRVAQPVSDPPSVTATGERLP